jgi:hypothetical protein
MPVGAVAVVIFGLVATLGVIAVDLRSGGGSADSTEWVTVEPVATPKPVKLGGGGSFGLSRTTIAAIAPIESGELLFRIAGVVELDSARAGGPAIARCDVTSPADGSFIARTPKRRAAWPRPSIELQAQAVPEEIVVKFKRRGAEVLGLPIRDSFRAYTDSAAPTDVDWDGFAKQTQNWVWTMSDGTGQGGATMAYAVVFKTTEKPRAEVVCTASSGGKDAKLTYKATQQEWPLVDPAVQAALDETAAAAAQEAGSSGDASQ